MDACAPLQTNQTFQRRRIAVIFIIALLAGFWILSRYPDLLKEYTRATNDTLVKRDVGVMSKDAMLATHNVTGPFERFFAAAIDWIETNKYGMSFGFFFSAAILLLLEQSRFLRTQATKQGIRGVFSGLLLGMPLGVCTNCATPVALGLKKAGVSDDASFTTLIASPSLNPVGILIIFLLFPVELVGLRVGVLLFFLIFILPLLTRLTGVVTAPLFDVAMPDNKAEPTESWQQSFAYCRKRYWHYLKYIVKQILPAMIATGFLGALVMVAYPLQTLLLGETESILQIILAGVLGTLLPMPMFVDIVMVYLFYQMGLSMSLVATLLLTLAPTSGFAMYVMGKHVSWRLSIAISSAICLLGIGAGLAIHYQQQAHGQANSPDPNFVPFKAVMTVKSLKPFVHGDFHSFFGSGVSLMDYDKDGNVDILLAGNHGARLYRNLGNMQFEDVTEKVGIRATDDTMAGIWCDFTNNGYPDLFLVNYRNPDGSPQANRLYLNDGHGKFKDATAEWGLDKHKDYSSAAACADYNNDGRVDLFVANYGTLKVVDGKDIHGRSQRDRLYRNDGNHFTDVTEKAGVSGTETSTKAILDIDHNERAGNRGFSFQPIWFDYNNDNLIDLFVTQDFGTAQLYRNNGDGTFTNVTKAMGLTVYGTSMGAAVLDINQDGFWDLLVTTGNKNQLWVNQHGQGFQDKVFEYGVDDNTRFGWGVAAIDYDNSGKDALFIVNGPTARGDHLNRFQDLMMKVGSINRFYVPTKDGRYQNLDKKFRLYNDMVSRGLAVGDLNNNGHQDMVITNRDDNAQLIVYQNQGSTNHSQQITLVGDGPINRMAIGAKVSVYVQGKPQHKLVMAGSSFLSQHSPVLHFGVGQATVIDKIMIHWPNGKEQVIKDVKVGKPMTIHYPFK